MESLVFALPNDIEHWNWAIDAALQRFVSPTADDIKPNEPDFFTQLRKLKIKLMNIEMDAEKEEIRHEMVQLKKKNSSIEAVYITKKKAYEEKLALRGTNVQLPMSHRLLYCSLSKNQVSRQMRPFIKLTRD